MSNSSNWISADKLTVHISPEIEVVNHPVNLDNVAYFHIDDLNDTRGTKCIAFKNANKTTLVEWRFDSDDDLLKCYNKLLKNTKVI